MVSQEQDRAFVRTFIAVVALLVAVTVGLIILASNTQIAAFDEERAALDRERAEARLQPTVAIRLSSEPMPETAAPEAPAAAEPVSAEQILAQTCATCHDTGLLDAPKTGAASDWEPRLAQGFDTLVDHAINGLGAMPPRGGNPSLTDEQVRETVVLMLEKSGLEAP